MTRIGWVGVAIAIGSVACRDGGSAGADASTSTSTSTSTSSPSTTTTTTATAIASGARDAGNPICRVMASEGGPAATADPTGWLDVAASANFTVRTLETGRELRFEGPGRVRACAGDVALVAEGTAVGLPGSGEAPGAEQWVATACGVARWASGVQRFAGARDICKLQSSMGSVHLYVAGDVTAEEVFDGGAPDGAVPPLDAGREEWRRIDAKHVFRLKGRGPLDTPAAVKIALGTCERAAQNVESLAVRMTGGDGGVGILAAESVVARGVARAACAVAAVRVALGGARPEDQTRLDAASARWRGGH